MTLKLLARGDKVLITCECCEPVLATVRHAYEDPCTDCGGRAYELETADRLLVDCCAAILRPLH